MVDVYLEITFLNHDGVINLILIIKPWINTDTSFSWALHTGQSYSFLNRRSFTQHFRQIGWSQDPQALYSISSQHNTQCDSSAFDDSSIAVPCAVAIISSITFYTESNCRYLNSKTATKTENRSEIAQQRKIRKIINSFNFDFWKSCLCFHLTLVYFIISKFSLNREPSNWPSY